MACVCIATITLSTVHRLTHFLPQQPSELAIVIIILALKMWTQVLGVQVTLPMCHSWKEGFKPRQEDSKAFTNSAIMQID